MILVSQKFLRYITKSMIHLKTQFYQNKKLWLFHKSRKRQVTDWKKKFAKHVSGKEPVSRIYC